LSHLLFGIRLLTSAATIFKTRSKALAGGQVNGHGSRRRTNNLGFWLCPSEIPKLNPNGIPAQSPGLRGTSYPGKSRQKANNPNGVAARWRKFDETPLGLKIPSATTQGSSFLATLGRRAQSLWDCRTAGASRVPLDFSFPQSLSQGVQDIFTYFVTSPRLGCRNR